MQYRKLGRSGLKVSELSFGSWVTYGNQVDHAAARELMAAAWDGGVNFFDNAEVYAGGQSEEIMGRALKDLKWDRDAYVVSTKFYFGLANGPNRDHTLNRKYLLSAIDKSLARMGLDYVDLVYCHRADLDTPIEETVWAMHDIIARGKALYWGTSEWTAEQIRSAYDIAERHHLHKPLMEQPQYNLFHRKRVEREYAPLYESMGLGITSWSPLASGLLTGKYRSGVPAGSRAELKSHAFLRDELTDPGKNDIVASLESVARELGCTVGQLAIAWCLKNPRVSTVITGASNVDQIRENLKAAEVAASMSDETKSRIEALVGPNHK